MAAPLPVRAAARVLRWMGWAVLALLAAAGLALSAVAFLAAVPFARPLVAKAVIRWVDDAIQGRVTLQGIAVLPQGGMEIRGLQVFDPDEHLVLSVGRARLLVDVTALRDRTVGFSVELDQPSVLVEEEADGGISLVRAFAPARQAPAARAPPPGSAPSGDGGWTLHFSHVAIRGGDLWWQDATGATRVEATGIDVAARGTVGPRRARAELRLAAQARSPAAAPVTLEVVLVRAGDGVRVPLLHATAGATALSAIAEGDLARRRGRLALTRLGVSREEARALLPAAPDGADLAAAGYAESDGATLTAAVRVEPVGQGAGGRGDAAVAARLEALRQAVGFDVVVEKLDPARLVATLPAGEVTLSAHGAAAGTDAEDLRGRVALTAGRSRLGRGELTRADLALRVNRGAFDLDRLSAALPGATVEGSGHWARGGPVSGTATVDAADLAVAARNGAALAATTPPPLAGRARVQATLSGTAAAPVLAGRVEAPSLRAGAVALDGVDLGVRAEGPLREVSGTVDGRIAAVRDGPAERAREVALRASVTRGEGTASLTGTVPAAGRAPVSLDVRWGLDPARERLEVRQLAVGYPGARWGLARPAVVDLRGPSVDRLELVDAPQRLVVEGGVGRRGALAASVELTRLDLARLPPGLRPAPTVRGEVSGRVQASGTTARPVVAARVSVAGGGYERLAGLAVTADARWDGGARRVAGTASVARADGGTVDAEVDLPVPLAGRAAEPVRARLRAAALPVPELLAVAGHGELPARGALAVELRVDGTAGAPSAAAELSLADGAWDDLDGLAALVTIDAPGDAARLVASGTLSGRRVLAVDASAPLDLGELLARPAETGRGLARAPLRAAVSVTALDLAAISGRAGVPPELAGIVEAHVELSGTAEAPRAVAAASLAGGAVGAWRGLGARVDASAADAGLSVGGVVTVHGDEALRVTGTLGIRPERLGDRRALEAAPLHVAAEIPRVALGRAAAEVVPLAGALEGRATVTGTPRAPELRAELSGAGVAVKGRPLGDARASVRYARARGELEVALRPPSGGALRATLGVAAELGVGAGGPALADAPAEATVVADDLDLGFLPALAPGLIRAAGGKIVLDVQASGPLRRMSPRGTLHLAGGRLAVVELGEWTDVGVDVKVTDDAVELTRFDVRRGKGTLRLTGAARGLRSDAAALSAKLESAGFTLSRAGMEVATLDLVAEATGTLTPGELSADVRIPRGTVRLPKRVPRALQPLEERKDIVVGRRPERRPPRAPAPAATPAAAPQQPFAYRIHAVAPGRLFVKSDDPKIDVELRADVRYELEEAGDFASGSVEVVRGSIEPIGGRVFVVDHGAVRFTNGPPDAALLDFQAKYTNPAAVVTAKVTGTLRAPDLKLTSSVPSMTDADVALLLLTGRTEPKAGSGAVGAITGEEAGKAVMAVLATQAFKNLVQDKLPLDTVALDAGGFRAGKYVTDKIYVGYVRRWDADPTKYQNEDEVRVEYQISPRWMFESRYGNAQSGGANLIWSRDY